MFCLDLKVTYEDGSEQTFSSGTDWKNSTGSLIFNSIWCTAEHHNAQLEQKGWNTFGFDDHNWSTTHRYLGPLKKYCSSSFASHKTHPRNTTGKNAKDQSRKVYF